MHDGKGKIFGIALFLLLILCLIYLTMFSNKNINRGKIEMVEVSGNNLLSENDYLAFTKLDDISKYNGITLPVIKDRFLKHPYVENAAVAFDGINKVKVILNEKRITALLLSNNEPFFITGNFQILPIFPNTKFTDLPVISNPNIKSEIKPLQYLKNEDVVDAFKLIEAAKLTNVKILKKIAEINLRNGGDIVLTLSGMKPPVIFGRGREAKKMVYLDIMWNGMSGGDKLLEESEYIDLRFANEIYLGQTEKTGSN